MRTDGVVAERTMMQFGEAAVSVSWFVQNVGPVFLSGTQQHVDPFGVLVSRCLYFFREELGSAGIRKNHQPHADDLVCVDVIISTVSKLSFPTSFGALAHCFRCQAPLEARRCEWHDSHKSERSSQGRQH